MLAYEEALKRVLIATKTLGTETVPIKQAYDRILAAPVTARINQPPFDGSAMDGYGVISSDIKAGATLENIGEAQAGAGFNDSVKSGECVRIFTGAPIPRGANAVVMQEHVEVNGQQITFQKPVRPGNNVRPMGQDFMQGDVLLQPGITLNPAAIALVAAANVPEVEIFRRPNISLLATGDELMPPGSELKSGQIVGSNGFTLGALFSPYAREITDLGSACDTRIALEEKFAQALKSRADIIISTGGASVGDHDLVLPTLKSLGVEIDFWKIAIRPGKPIIFGKKDNKLIFALPGNPVSAYVCAVSVVIPAILAVCGHANPLPKCLSLPLATAMPANGFRRHFMRGKIIEIDGKSCVKPILQTDSSHLSTLAQADVLLVALENSGELDAGSIVQAIPLP